VNRHAWLQKHPSPLTSDGEFHWYPDVPQVGDRELRAGLVERVRGIEPPAVLWQLERGRVAWGQVFSATAPLDGGAMSARAQRRRGHHRSGYLLAILSRRGAPWNDALTIAPRLAVQTGRRAAQSKMSRCGARAAVGRRRRIDDPEARGCRRIRRSSGSCRDRDQVALRWCEVHRRDEQARDRVVELRRGVARNPASPGARVTLLASAPRAASRSPGRRRARRSMSASR
jgi:hypothetical protein